MLGMLWGHLVSITPKFAGPCLCGRYFEAFPSLAACRSSRRYARSVLVNLNHPLTCSPASSSSQTSPETTTLAFSLMAVRCSRCGGVVWLPTAFLYGLWILICAEEGDAHIVRMDSEGRLTMSEQSVKIACLQPPVDPVGILCIGLNYKKHAAETKSPIPKYPGALRVYGVLMVGR